MKDPATFLHVQAVCEIKERLKFINRTFTAPVIVTGWPEVWETEFPDSLIVEDQEALDLEPHAHDLVIHAMALHWANDPVGQIIQARRALKPDGLFLGSMFGGKTLHELRAVLAEAEVATTGGLSPRIAPMAEIRETGALLQRAGLALPVADCQTTTVSYRDAYHLMQDLRAMGETNAMSARRDTFSRRSLFTAAAKIYAETFPTAKDRIAATYEVIHLSGWAPDQSQQQPLRPGSATTLLADILGVDETQVPNED